MLVIYDHESQDSWSIFVGVKKIKREGQWSAAPKGACLYKKHLGTNILSVVGIKRTKILQCLPPIMSRD